MYLLLIKQFLRSRITIVALLLLLVMGSISILIGKQFLLKQEQTITKVTEHQRTHLERNVAAHDEMGLLLYYLRFSLISKPDKLAALSVGQRDVNPGVQSVTIRTLEAQKYDTDLTNPVQLQSGNLDLGFVIIYLFPLIIIAFTFNLFAEDNESGTWKLISVQSKSAIRFLVSKFLVRALFVYGELLILFLLATLVLSLPLTKAFIAFIIVSVLYITFWFALCFWLSMFKRSSGFNVLALLTIWVTLTVLLPAAVNNFVASVYPVPEALSTIVKQRDGYHKKWDLDKKVTMGKFYAHYPQFSKYGIPNDNFWIWYYAMQQMGDDESANESRAMREKLLQREQLSRKLALAIPTMHVQMNLNDLAQTGLTDYLRLLDSAVIFHEKTRLYFYPKIFDKASVKAEYWSKFQPAFLSPRQELSWGQMISPLILLIVLLIAWAFLRSVKLNTI
jgi:ABC-2 type transport system permease protein